PVRYQAPLVVNEKKKTLLTCYGDVLPDNQRSLVDTWSFDLGSGIWTMLDNNSAIPLFTFVAATKGDIFVIATGEMRGGTQVRCIDPINGKGNNPVDINRVLDMSITGSTYRTVNPDLNILPTM